MNIIFAKDVEIYSFPLGEDLASGYNELVKRVCEVKAKHGNWSGVLISDTVMSSGLFGQEGKEFDVQFYKQPQTHGFLLHNFGDVIEMAVGCKPDAGRLFGVSKFPVAKEKLFVIGNFFGRPFSIASCRVLMMGSSSTLNVMKESSMDLHVCGAPAFNVNGQIVGIVDAYIPDRNMLIIRGLISNEDGALH